MLLKIFVTLYSIQAKRRMDAEAGSCSHWQPPLLLHTHTPPWATVKARVENEQKTFSKKSHLYLTLTLWCHHSLESSRRDDSNEWSHHRVC